MKKKGKIILGTFGVLILLSIVGNLNKGDEKSNSSVQTKTSTVSITSSVITTEKELIEPEEHNSSAYVDYLALKAKEDSATASDESIQEAIQWITNNIDSIFKDNESMEKAIYYGELIEYKYKGVDEKYEKIGWQTFKTVKYVYRGVEGVEDEVTVNNYNELKSMLNPELEANKVETIQTEAQQLVSKEFENALKKAETYSSITHMSKTNIYDQLVSEYGEQFTVEAANYAMENLKADFNANALEKAKTYSKTMNMSKIGIYEQLTSEHGESFTPEEAQYAVDNLVADYNNNALEKAKTYQKTLSMSSNEIYDQLISEYGEKFTPEQAQYAIDNLG